MSDATPAASPDKQKEAEKVLKELLGLMDVPAKLELKDAEDGGIAVAIHPEVELPGGGGRRSSVSDALAFLTNKIINRQGDKRWVSIGLGQFPEPRRPKTEPQPRPQPAPSPVAAPAGQPAPRRAPAPASPAPAAVARPAQVDERTLEVSADPVVEALGRTLAQRAAALGRIYAVAAATPQDRARLMRGAAEVATVQARAEGDGRARRLVFMPQNPKPMPKPMAMPDFDDEDEQP